MGHEEYSVGHMADHRALSYVPAHDRSPHLNYFSIKCNLGIRYDWRIGVLPFGIIREFPFGSKSKQRKQNQNLC